MTEQTIINADCLEYMKTLPDKSFDLILTDPPYGLNIGKMNFTNSTNGGVAKRNDYSGIADWDKYTPSSEVFDEIRRVSKAQIVFGGQYFTDKLPTSGMWLVWDKRTEDKYSNDFADCEFAWTSENKPSRVFRFLWSGMMQQDMKNKEKRVHPTQKPIPVISWCLSLFPEAQTILDPFMGSGTTLVAAKQLNRNATGIEISEKYCEIARRRLEQSTLL